MLKSYQAELNLNAGMASVLHDVNDRKQKVKAKRFVWSPKPRETTEAKSRCQFASQKSILRLVRSLSSVWLLGTCRKRRIWHTWYEVAVTTTHWALKYSWDMLTNLKYLNWHHLQSYCTLGTVGLALNDFQSLFDLGPAAMTSWIQLQGTVVFATQRFRLPHNFTLHFLGHLHQGKLEVQWPSWAPEISAAVKTLCTLYWIRKRWERWRWNWWNRLQKFVPIWGIGR